MVKLRIQFTKPKTWRKTIVIILKLIKQTEIIKLMKPNNQPSMKRRKHEEKVTKCWTCWRSIIWTTSIVEWWWTWWFVVSDSEIDDQKCV